MLQWSSTRSLGLTVRRAHLRASTPAAVVQLSTGPVSGEILDGVVHYGGIPFAAPPTGERRWRRPQPPKPWKHVLDCTSYRRDRRARPVQSPSAFEVQRSRWKERLSACFVVTVLLRLWRAVMRKKRPAPSEPLYIESEDCLHLDVWTPSEAIWNTQRQSQDGSAKKLPVMMWIYGGGLVSGSKDNPGQSGRPYAERGIVFVAANYRVGALGFLCPGGGDANCGLWDQVAALQWIRGEIDAFGGDPANVTIMGESGGADSVYWLSCSPVANSLFHRAIMQSPASFAITSAQATEIAEEFATVVGAKSAEIADMQALSVEEIVKAQLLGKYRIYPTTSPGWRELMVGEVPKEDPSPDPTPAGLFRFPTGEEFTGWPMPVVVIDGNFMTQQPLDALANRAAAHLDIIIGANRDEDAFYAEAGGGYGRRVLDWNMQGMPPHIQNALRGEFAQRMVWEIAGMPAVANAQPDALRQHVERLMSTYEEERKADLYGLGPSGNSESPAQWLQDTMYTDFGFLAAVLLMSERLARPGGARRVFRYQFEGFNGKGGIHAAELELMLGEDADLRNGSFEVRREWIDSYAEFARKGDPNTPSMAGKWRPHSDADRPVMLWDGVQGCKANGGDRLAQRKGLFAAARLWEDMYFLKKVDLIQQGFGPLDELKRMAQALKFW